MADNRTDSVSSLPELLTDREREILDCLVRGFSNQEIAARLHLALRTVKWYNSQIYKKFGASNRKEAIQQAAALGLLGVTTNTKESIPRNNLPIQPTRFVGRQRELAFLANLFVDPNIRLVTILAPGGMGKTRLALAAAERQLRYFKDGTFFVPLAPLRSPDDIVTAIAENVGFSFYGSASPKQQILDYFRDRQILLVLDNFEHLLDGASLVGDILQAAPDLRMLITSREQLNLQSETIYALRGLEFPTRLNREHIQNYDAVKLFMQSAYRVRPGFELRADDLTSLARICRLTDGMPLGIELAAGWLDILSIEHIADEIQQGIDILETNLRDFPERHRSIRATFEITWRRLTDEERAIFRTLSVFRGGFTLPAAQAVAGASARHLRGLAQKALIQIEGNERFAIHELLRQFGADKLTETHGLPNSQARHGAFFAEFMQEREQDARTNRQLEALALIDPDFENVRSAWLHTVNRGDWEQLPKFLYSLWFYLDVRTRGQEALELLEQAVNVLRSAPSSRETELALGRVLARLGWFYGDAEITERERGAATCDEAIRILRRHNSPEDLIAALHARQNVANNLMQLDVAARVAQEGLAVARSMGDIGWEGYLLGVAAWTSTSQGNLASALQFAEEGLAVCEGQGNRWGAALIYSVLAWIKESQEEYEPAKHWFQQALTILEDFGRAYDIAVVHIGQAKIALHQRNYVEACQRLGKGLQGWRDAGYKRLLPYGLVYAAQMFADQNALDKAVEVLAALPKGPVLLMEADQVAQTLRVELQAKMEPERFAAAWARGQAQGLSVVVADLLAEFADE